MEAGPGREPGIFDHRIFPAPLAGDHRARAGELSRLEADAPRLGEQAGCYARNSSPCARKGTGSTLASSYFHNTHPAVLGCSAKLE